MEIEADNGPNCPKISVQLRRRYQIIIVVIWLLGSWWIRANDDFTCQPSMTRPNERQRSLEAQTM
jgi:hypothetical protein